jgi:hypothetical protein
VGAGTLNHLSYENQYSSYSVVEPAKYLYQEEDVKLSNISSIYDSLDDVPYQLKYDRIISIAVLEHMTELPKELMIMKSLLHEDGLLQVAIPTEGGFLWGIAWRLTTGIFYRLRTGQSYTDIMRHEHVNDEKEILALLNHFFTVKKVKRFPFSARHLSFYTYIEATHRIDDATK